MRVLAAEQEGVKAPALTVHSSMVWERRREIVRSREECLMLLVSLLQRKCTRYLPPSGGQLHSHRQGTILILRPADGIPHPRRSLECDLLARQRGQAATALQGNDDLATLVRTCGLQLSLQMSRHQSMGTKCIPRGAHWPQCTAGMGGISRCSAVEATIPS